MLLVARRFIPSTVAFDEIVPRLLKDVSEKFQLFDDVALLVVLLEEVVDDEVVLEEVLDEEVLLLDDELLDGHCASSKYQIWFAVPLLVHCITFAPDAVLKLSTSRQLL